MATMSDSDKIQKREVVASGQWLQLIKTTWLKENGEPHVWEGVKRVGANGCVMVIARLQPSGDFLLVEQFRPPLGQNTLEFPAGLVDDDEDIQQAALRELKEETGYHGTLDSLIPSRALSPGLGSERIAIALVQIDETLEQNQKPQQALESTEEGLKVHRISLEQLLDLLEKETFQGAEIEAKLSSFILGYSLGLRG